jgi:hypothetical protein
VDKGTLGTTQFHYGYALYAEGKVINGETTSNWGKGVIIVAKEVIIRRSAPTGTLTGTEP